MGIRTLSKTIDLKNQVSTTTKYITAITNTGIKIHPAVGLSNNTQYVLINGNGLYINKYVDGTNDIVLGSYTPTNVNIGLTEENQYSTNISNDVSDVGISMRLSNEYDLLHLDNSGLDLYDETLVQEEQAQSNPIAHFGDGIILGEHTDNGLVGNGIILNTETFSIYDDNTDEVFSVKQIGDTILYKKLISITRSTNGISTISGVFLDNYLTKNVLSRIGVRLRLNVREVIQKGALKHTKARYYSYEYSLTTTPNTYSFNMAVGSKKIALKITTASDSSGLKITAQPTSGFPSDWTEVYDPNDHSTITYTIRGFTLLSGLYYLYESVPMVGGRAYKVTDDIIQLGNEVFCPGHLTGSRGTINFTINLNRLIPSTKEVASIVGGLLIRCNGYYIVEDRTTGATAASFDTTADFLFHNADDANKTLTADKWVTELNGAGGNIRVGLHSETENFFSSSNNSVNNRAIDVRLSNCIIYLQDKSE